MNYEEFKEYVDKMNKNIANKLKDNAEELAFYTDLVIRFNNICDEKIKLENALDEIENIFNEYTTIRVDDLLDIIKEAKGE